MPRGSFLFLLGVFCFNQVGVAQNRYEGSWFNKNWNIFQLRKADTLVYLKGEMYAFVDADLNPVTDFKYKAVYAGHRNHYVVKTDKGFSLLNSNLYPIIAGYDSIYYSNCYSNYRHGEVFICSKNGIESMFSSKTRKFLPGEVDCIEASDIDYQTIKTSDNSGGSVEQVGKEPYKIEPGFSFSEKIEVKRKKNKTILSLGRKTLLKTKNEIVVHKLFYADVQKVNDLNLYHTAVDTSLGSFQSLWLLGNEFIVAVKNSSSGYDPESYIFNSQGELLFQDFGWTSIYDFDYRNQRFKFFEIKTNFRTKLYNLEGQLIFETKDIMEIKDNALYSYVYDFSDNSKSQKIGFLGNLNQPIQMKYNQLRTIGDLIVARTDSTYDLYRDNVLIEKDLNTFGEFNDTKKSTLLVATRHDSTILYHFDSQEEIDRFKGAIQNNMNFPTSDGFFKYWVNLDGFSPTYGVRSADSPDFLAPDFLEIANDKKNELFIVLLKSGRVGYIKYDGTPLFE